MSIKKTLGDSPVFRPLLDVWSNMTSNRGCLPHLEPLYQRERGQVIDPNKRCASPGGNVRFDQPGNICKPPPCELLEDHFQRGLR